MNTYQNPLARFFGVPFRGQTYLNLIYLALAFPLGLAYFIFLVVGASLGFALLILLIGFLILALLLAGGWLLAAFERQMAIWLLNEDIPPMTTARQRAAESQGFLEQVKAFLLNPVTWTGLAFLFLKFPLGIISFVVLVTFGAMTGAFLAAPFVYTIVPYRIDLWYGSSWSIDTLQEALVLFLVGVALLFISLHLFNALAWASAKVARLLLGQGFSLDGRPQPLPVPPLGMAVPPPPAQPAVARVVEPVVPPDASPVVPAASTWEATSPPAPMQDPAPVFVEGPAVQDPAGMSPSSPETARPEG